MRSSTLLPKQTQQYGLHYSVSIPHNTTLRRPRCPATTSAHSGRRSRTYIFLRAHFMNLRCPEIAIKISPHGAQQCIPRMCGCPTAVDAEVWWPVPYTPASFFATMKTIVPVALGATCLGLQLVNNHPVDAFVVTIPAGEEGIADSPATAEQLHAWVRVAFLSSLECCYVRSPQILE